MLSILNNSDMPISYSLDVGVDDQGDTLLVEVNDCYALGNYGLDATTYTNMLYDRWKEIVGE